MNNLSRDPFGERLQAHAEQMSFFEARIEALETKVMMCFQILDANDFQMQGRETQTQMQRNSVDSPSQEVLSEQNFLPQEMREIDRNMISEQHIQLIECLQDVAAEQAEEHKCGLESGVSEQHPERHDLRSELHRLSDQTQALEEQVAMITTALKKPVGSEPATRPTIVVTGEQTLRDLESLDTEPYRNMSFSNLLHKKVKKEVTYEWQESLWDAAIFIQSTEMPSAVTTSVVVCLLFDFIFTLFSLALCQEMVSDRGFDESSRSDFDVWRTTVAHDVHLRDRLTGQSLARNVCDRNFGVPYSTLQLDAVSTIYSYMGEGFWPMGKLMCCLALCIWYLTLLIELRSIASVVRAFIRVPVDQQTFFRADPHDKSKQPKMQLVSVSHGRLAFLIILGLLRLIIMVLLGLIGTQYLCSETSPEEMLLNSVALQLILNFDELLYVSMLPKMAQIAMTRILPLTYTLHQKQRAIFSELVLRVSLIVTLLCGSIIFVLFPFVEELNANFNALCGGVEDALDFVMAVDAIGIPWAAATPKESRGSMSYARSAVAHVMHNGFAQNTKPLAVTERNNMGYFMQIATGVALQTLTSTGQMFKFPKDWQVISQERAHGVVGWNEIGVLKDQDFGDALNTVYNHYLEFLLEAQWLDTSAPGTVNCSHVPAECCYTYGSNIQDVVMRQLCPSRCGCDLPTSGTVGTPLGLGSTFAFAGCGPMNLRRPAFVNKLSELPCHDTNSSGVFASWVHGVGNAPSQNASHGALADELMAFFQRGGCPEVVKVGFGVGTNACSESSLPAVCPKSCGCIIGQPWLFTDARHKDYCPYSCEAVQQPCMTLLKNHDIEAGDRYLGEGYACTFPFQYEGQIYHNCTDVDWDGLWCAITLENGRVHYWSDCPVSC